MELVLRLHLGSCHQDAEEPSGAPAKLVLAGCGAVTRLYYAEALSRLERNGAVEVIGVFDPDACAMAAVCAHLSAAKAKSRFEDLLDVGANAAIVASPPCFHAEQAVRALKSGLHVFCEKPLATTCRDADRILEASETAGLHAGIGLVRRYFPATRTIKQMLDNRLIGRLCSVSCFEGGPFDWPVASPRYFSRVEAGGGILLDLGTHCLDLLTWWFGPPNAISYVDDAMGGIEANCLLLLQYDEFEARIRLSRDWGQPNIYCLEGECGSISWTVNDTQSLGLHFTKAGTSGRVSLDQGSGQSSDFVGCFAAQIAGFVGSLRSGAPPPVPACVGHKILALIEQCYADRRLMDMPWLSDEERSRAARLSEFVK
jgi:predicted dehydrogenase